MRRAPTLGLLMLQTRFPRLPGDVGAASTFPFPVVRRVVGGASPRRVVVDADPELSAPFVAAARSLQAEGVAAITTSCGFLAPFQGQLQASVEVPVWTSSLLLVGELQAALPSGRRVGIVTVDAASLTPARLAVPGVDGDVPVEGLHAESEFRRTLLDDLPTLDAAAAEANTVAAALRLLARAPAVDAIVLECTNMPPYAEAVRAATGRAVHDITTLVRARFAALCGDRIAPS